ncbi:MAG: efflux RND transporter periplasmic adaptor subunit [Thermoguttaceae bacterium]
MNDAALGVENTPLAEDPLEDPQSAVPPSLAPRKAERAGSPGAPPDRPPQPSRRPWVWALLCALGIAGVAGGTAYYYFFILGYESTDDAFIAGHVVSVSPRVAGHVSAVHVTDNQWVEAGDPLVDLDPSDFQARLAAAEAALQAARAGQRSRTFGADVTEITSSAGEDEAAAAVEGAKADVTTARAAAATAQSQQAEAQAQLAATQAALEQAHSEVRAADARHQHTASYIERIKDLVPKHAVAQEAYDEAVAKDRVAEAELSAAGQRVIAQEAAVKQAEAAVAAAQSGLRQAEAALEARVAGQQRAKAHLAAAKSAPQQVDQSRSQTHVAQFEAARAEAERTQAALKLSYTAIRAPVAGHVSRKNVEPGDYVEVGQPLVALVEPDVWVVANFKETQLTNMRVGQPVSVEVDVYPGVKFAAYIDSIQRGSGAYFSLLPPENATGNYVKVVQRVPVKIRFKDPKQVAQYLLGPGMSVVPTVDIRAPAGSAAMH